MKINFNKNFKGLHGEETQDLISVLVAQALYNYGAEKSVKHEEKFKAYRLSQLIIGNPDEVEITTEEATLIKSICGECFTAGGYGQIYELIENGGQ